MAVAEWKIERAKARGLGMENVDVIAEVAAEAGVPFAAALALFECESHGRNVYGNDEGGTLSGFKRPVNMENYRVFEWLVFEKGGKSNGVGPSQITWPAYFPDMASKGLKPWDLRDNMLYGMQLIARHKQTQGTWEKAGKAYNGRESYGVKLNQKRKEWRDWIRAGKPTN